VIRGSLFTRYYLEDGIRGAEAYRALDDAQLDQATRGPRSPRHR
jgi:hypothetical protein